MGDTNPRGDRAADRPNARSAGPPGPGPSAEMAVTASCGSSGRTGPYTESVEGASSTSATYTLT